MTGEGQLDPLSVIGKSEILQIRLLEHLERLFDCSSAINYAVDAVGQNREKLADFMSRGVPEILHNKEIWKDPESNETAHYREEIQEKLEAANRRRVGRFIQILVNQSVVLMCSVLDVYFNHVLDIVSKVEPKTLITLSPDRKILLQEFLHHSSYDANVDAVREKELSKFDYESLDEKFKKFRKLGINDDAVFDASRISEEALKRLSGFNLDTLRHAYDSRHEIVHRSALPIDSMAAAALLTELFQHTMFGLAIAASEKFKVPIDFLGYHAPWMGSPPEEPATA